MIFEPELEKAILLRRYKRFLADVKLAGGEVVTVHCPNTGSMKDCMQPGSAVWLSRATNKRRKYALTWEIAATPSGHLAGINSARANALVREALESGLIPELSGSTKIRAEVPFGERSRLDFVVENAAGLHYVEVKSVTLCGPHGQGLFPDAVSERGARHLRELASLAQAGKSAALVFCAQHSCIAHVAPARDIDPAYASAFDQALSAGVRMYALGATISESGIVLDRRLQVTAVPQVR